MFLTSCSRILGFFVLLVGFRSLIFLVEQACFSWISSDGWAVTRVSVFKIDKHSFPFRFLLFSIPRGIIDLIGVIQGDSVKLILIRAPIIRPSSLLSLVTDTNLIYLLSA